MSIILPLFLSGCSDSPAPNRTKRLPVELYLIARPGSGLSGDLIGCNDTIVSVKDTLAGADRPVAGLMTKLLARQNDDKRYTTVDGLRLDTVINQTPVRVYMRGHPRLRGICDHPRIRQQLYRTAQQLPAVDSVLFYINGRELDEILSLKGR